MTTLYYFAGACSLVPHIVARELELDVTAVAAPRPDDVGRPDYLDTINSLGKVPALQLNDGMVVTQNIAIVEYLAALGEAQGKTGVVYPKLGTVEHAQALRWLSFANSDIHPSFAPLFRPQRFSNDVASHPMIKAMATELLLDLYAHADGEYANKDWIANNQYSAADVYIYVTYRWAIARSIDLTPYRNLKKMVDAIQIRPAVLKAIKEQGIALI